MYAPINRGGRLRVPATVKVNRGGWLRLPAMVNPTLTVAGALVSLPRLNFAFLLFFKMKGFTTF
jgi:hypothetical protein